MWCHGSRGLFRWLEAANHEAGSVCEQISGRALNLLDEWISGKRSESEFGSQTDLVQSVCLLPTNQLLLFMCVVLRLEKLQEVWGRAQLIPVNASVIVGRQLSPWKQMISLVSTGSCFSTGAGRCTTRPVLFQGVDQLLDIRAADWSELRDVCMLL